MKRPTLHLVIPTLALAISLPAPLDAQEVTEYGPQSGTLVIVGGGLTDGTGIIERFIELGRRRGGGTVRHRADGRGELRQGRQHPGLRRGSRLDLVAGPRSRQRLDAPNARSQNRGH